jgi:DNA polymerase-1
MHRAFNALPKLNNKHSEPTGALYGVLRMLRRLLLEYQPEYVAVVLDAPGKTFRHEMFAEYKATRKPIDLALAQQIEPMCTFVRALGLTVLQVVGVEADDVIGTLTRQASSLELPVIIVSGDKDLSQLVDYKVWIIDAMNNNMVTDIIKVKNKFGVTPNLIGDWLALVGDIVDNIPGIPGIGAVTATKLLNKYGSLDGIIANASAIPGRVGEQLRFGMQTLLLSRQLVTLDCGVQLPIKFEEIHIMTPDTVVLRSLYQRYEFSSWLSEI